MTDNPQDFRNTTASWSGLPATSRVILSLIGALSPMLAFFACTMFTRVSFGSLFLAVAGDVSACLYLALTVQRGRASSLVATLIGVGWLVPLFFFTHSIGVSICGLLLIAAAVRRVLRFVNRSLESELHRGLMIDSIVLTTANLLIEIQVQQINTFNQTLLLHWFLAISLYSMVLWLSAIWYWGTNSRPRTGALFSIMMSVFILLTIVLLCVGTVGILATLLTLFVTFGVLASPLIRLLGPIKIQIHPNAITQIPNGLTSDTLTKSLSTNPNYFGFITTLLLVCVTVMAFYFMLRVKKKSSYHHETQQPLEMERSWLTTTLSPKFLPTDNPVRRAYQAWLSQQFRAGRIIRLGETPRKFRNRLKDENEVVENGLTAEYERVRYGNEKETK